jgi:hypothetical protein
MPDAPLRVDVFFDLACTETGLAGLRCEAASGTW